MEDPKEVTPPRRFGPPRWAPIPEEGLVAPVPELCVRAIEATRTFLDQKLEEQASALETLLEARERERYGGGR